MFGRATIRLDIGPHSSIVGLLFILYATNSGEINVFINNIGIILSTV